MIYLFTFAYKTSIAACDLILEPNLKQNLLYSFVIVFNEKKEDQKTAYNEDHMSIETSAASRFKVSRVEMTVSSSKIRPLASFKTWTKVWRCYKFQQILFFLLELDIKFHFQIL